MRTHALRSRRLVVPEQLVHLAYVSIRQHTSADAEMRAHALRSRRLVVPEQLVHLAYVSIRQHTSAYVACSRCAKSCRGGRWCMTSPRSHATSAYVSIRQHTSAYVSIRQHTSAYVSG
jgi:hypothetical protein